MILSGCVDLDLNPKSAASSGNWYKSESQFEMSVLELYNFDYWWHGLYKAYGTFANDQETDDFSERDATLPQSNGTLSGTSDAVKSLWTRTYQAIAYSNAILANIKPAGSVISETKLKQYEAEARFVRACMYSTLISYFGDVPFSSELISIDEAFTMGRTNTATILNSIYDDYDFAATNLPKTYSNNEYYRATKGAALAMKTRIALYQGDWKTARDAAKACMDLNQYSLHSNYRDLFVSKTKDKDEVIFKIPMSVALGVSIGSNANLMLPRTAGGYAMYGMSWDLFCSYLCTDGLPIDESPLFNPQDPFRNRDPRLTMNTVEWGTEWLGYIFQPHPDSIKTLNVKTGQYVTNKDCKGEPSGTGLYSVFSALLWKKWIDETWTDDMKADPDFFIIRYADVLEMYAEAKIELKEIDQSVFDAMNMVRARAYGVDKSQTSKYPEINITDQSRLIKILKMERRMEFCTEGLRYMDLVRWKAAEVALNHASYGWYNAVLMKKIVNAGLWPLPEIPKIDENGIPDLTPIYEKGYYTLLGKWKFDPTKSYLYPIPSSEILINKNLTQNPGY